jgi:hypothetical protein
MAEKVEPETATGAPVEERTDLQLKDEQSGPPGVMIPSRGKRSPAETVLMRVIATIGVIAIGVAIAAIMGSQHSKGWLIGLVVSVVTVTLAGFLWSSRRL